MDPELDGRVPELEVTTGLDAVPAFDEVLGDAELVLIAEERVWDAMIAATAKNVVTASVTTQRRIARARRRRARSSSDGRSRRGSRRPGRGAPGTGRAEALEEVMVTSMEF